MDSYLPAHALAFRDLFAKVEHTLRRGGYMRADRKKAEVDWRRFARDLGDPFFSSVRDSGKATTLIEEPPRAYHREGGWQPQNQTPIGDVIDLLMRGVCQVRHNIEHGEKYVMPEGDRADTLVAEARWVLEQAIDTHPLLKNALVQI